MSSNLGDIYGSGWKTMYGSPEKGGFPPKAVSDSTAPMSFMPGSILHALIADSATALELSEVPCPLARTA